MCFSHNSLTKVIWGIYSKDVFSVMYLWQKHSWLVDFETPKYWSLLLGEISYLSQRDQRTMASFYSSVAVSHDSATVDKHKAQTMSLKKINGIQKLFILILTHVLHTVTWQNVSCEKILDKTCFNNAYVAWIWTLVVTSSMLLAIPVLLLL